MLCTFSVLNYQVYNFKNSITMTIQNFVFNLSKIFPVRFFDVSHIVIFTIANAQDQERTLCVWLNPFDVLALPITQDCEAATRS